MGPSEDSNSGIEFPDQSRARRAGAAPPDLPDQDARAHLRPRRRADPRQPQSLRPRRRAALRPAAAGRGEAGRDGARLHRHAALVRPRRSADSTRSSGRRTARAIAEVAQALTGAPARMVRVNDRGEVIVSVAVPVQRFRAVRGALMLSTQGADIDDMVEAERLAIVKVFLIAAAVMVVLSMLLAGTIAGPVRRLADGAERVRRRIRTRVEIPDFTRRRDEIGHLSGALRDMTERALYPHRGDRELCRRRRARAEQPAHLAALGGRDAAARQDRGEPQAPARGDRARRQAARPADHRHLRRQPPRRRIAAAGGEPGRSAPSLLDALVKAANEVRNDEVTVTLAFEGGGAEGFKVPGHDSRLGQVISNLIDNARSFSPAGGRVQRDLPAAARTRSRSPSTTTAPASGRTRWRRFSSASIPTGRTRASGRIPASACRSPSRSSRPMAAASGRRTALCRRRGRARSRACSAPVSWCACRRNSRARLAAPPRGSPRRLTLGRKPGYPRPPRPAEKINHSRPRIAAAENGPHRAPFGPSFSQCSRAPI